MIDYDQSVFEPILMIITRAPFRVSFFGGGSDLASFYSQHKGSVLSVTINKYMYISTHRYYQKNRFNLKYSATENVGSIDEIKHPLLREILKLYKPHIGIEISSVADIPSGTGLGSSSAFAVGTIHNLLVRLGKNCSKDDLAKMACEIEIEKLKEPIGKQDQYASAFGGLNIFDFQQDGRVAQRAIILPSELKKSFLSSLVMFYTGTTRPTSAILAEQKSNIESKNSHVDTLKSMVAMVPEAEKFLYQEDFEKFGKLLHDSWLMKKSLASKITNSTIDEIYKSALSAGAYGGKLLGAGGGGFLLFVCPPENKSMLKQKLSSLEEIPFKFDEEGAKVVFYGEEQDD